MPQNIILKQSLSNWGLFILLSLIWGSSFMLMKEGMKALSPYQVATIRILSAGLVMIPFFIKAYKQIPADKRGYVILSGTIGSFIPAYLFCLSEIKIDSSLVGMLNALTPLFTIVVGILFFDMKVVRRQLMGITIGFIGMILLLTPKGNFGLQEFGYASLVLLATFLYGINVNVVHKTLKDTSSINIVAFAFPSLLIPCIAILAKTGFFNQMIHSPGKQFLLSTAAAFVLGSVGTAFATVYFYRLMKRAGIVFASMVTYGIPFIAVAWGLILGETLSALEMISLFIILAGVGLCSKRHH